MKNLLSLFAIIILAAFAMNGCKERPDSPVDPAPEYSIMQDFTAEDIIAVQAIDLDHDMVILPFAANDLQPILGPTDNMGPREDMKKPGPMPLERLFRELKLTERQLAKVRELQKQERECMERIRLRMQEAMKPIMEEANAKKAEIMRKLKAGEITREEAAKMLRRLNAETQKKMKESDAMKAAMEAMKKCRETFLSEVEKILTEEQLAIWKKRMGGMMTGQRP